MRADKIKQTRRQRRKEGIRKRISGTADQPRLTVYRSLKHIYAQIIDDVRGVTLCEASTRSKELRGAVVQGGDKAAAKAVGVLLAQRALSRSIKSVQFDRNGYRFGGRVAVLAGAAREGGLSF
jgi:large subunit ribosomal protein L18